MAARTPPFSGSSHFSFSSASLPLPKSPSDILEEVEELLAGGDITSAIQVFKNAQKEGVFLDALGTSFDSWAIDNEDKEIIKKLIAKAIAIAIANSRRAQDQHLQTSKLNPSNKV